MKKMRNPQIISYCIADKKVKVRNGKSPDAHIKTIVVGAVLKRKSVNNNYLGEPTTPGCRSHKHKYFIISAPDARFRQSETGIKTKGRLGRVVIR